MRLWRALALVIVAMPAAAQPPGTNYDEAKVPVYTLPDPLRFEDGRKATSPDAWRERRSELLRLFEQHVYGRSPGAPAAMRVEAIDTASDALSGLARRRQLRVLLDGTESGPAFDILLYVPRTARRPVPAFLGLNFGGNHTVHSDPGIRLSKAWMRDGPGVVDHRATDAARGGGGAAWPVERILERGYALATVYYGDLEPDHADGWRQGVRAQIGPGTSGRFAADDWGAIGAWAWGLQRALDYLESDPDVDARRVAVIGHSRLGKTALWAGAQDERFALVVSNDSGEGGAALARRKFGERTEGITRNFPHWFCGRYREYGGREEALPVDQHQLLALVAPRPLYVASATEDLWADPRGEFLAAKAAEPVYRLLGLVGLGVAEPPAPDRPVGGSIGYHLRSGPHALTAYDWERYLDFADRQLRGSRPVAPSPDRVGPSRGPEAAVEPAPRKMSRAVLEDKIRGGWAGQMIGVAFGAPTEFQSNGKILEGELRWTPEMIANTIQQDDLYVEMTFAEVMDRIGLDATTEQYGEMFRDSQYRLWHANAGARRNLARGIKAPMSGHPDYNAHANDIDFQIESDFIGLMCPGLPQASNHYASRVGRVMNYGDGLYGGMFFGAMYAAAFFEADPRRVVEQGLLSIPAASGYARIVRDVLAWHAQNPTDWRKTWRLIEEKWNRGDLCPAGALVPFNIDARLNGAYVVLGLLYGEGGFAKTLDVATRAGQDSDCNPSSAAGILGVMLGYERIPQKWRAGIPGLADTKFAFTQYSFEGIVASTLARAEKVIVAAGGTVGADEVVVPAQAPIAPPLEQWDPGVPVARVEHDQEAWSWKGGWTTEPWKGGRSRWTVKRSAGAGDEATLSFEGTGVAIVGSMTQDGGRADVYLDGARAGEIDAWVPERTHDDDYWHVTGLANGPHSVRIVVRGDADARSSGRRLQLERAVVYGPRP